MEARRGTVADGPKPPLQGVPGTGPTKGLLKVETERLAEHGGGEGAIGPKGRPLQSGVKDTIKGAPLGRNG